MQTHPPWLRKRIVINDAFFETKKILSELSINTVCQSGKCPNMSECFSSKRATFMILGRSCTRNCAFCSVGRSKAEPVDIDEPRRIADCAKRLGSNYIIVTSVTRDDLADGGASQFVRAVDSIKRALPDAVIELLVPDFAGKMESIRAVALSGAYIAGHNIETIERLYPVVRREADYTRSLNMLRSIKDANPKIMTKSAILAGMGETEDEILNAMKDLSSAGCDMLTIGQYLRPSEENHPVDRFVEPEEFERLKNRGMELGFKNVSAGPFVRSSYMAEEEYDKCYIAAVS